MVKNEKGEGRMLQPLLGCGCSKSIIIKSLIFTSATNGPLIHINQFIYVRYLIVEVNPFEHATKSIYNLDLTLIKSRTFPYMLGKVEGPSFRGRRFS